MGGGQVADDFLTDPSELQVVSESFSEDGPVLEVNSDLGLQHKPSRTLLLVGRSGNGKSATGNSILGRQAFQSRRWALGVTSACELQSSIQPNGQILNVIDTPGLFSLSPSTEFTCRELWKCLRLSKEGIDAVLVIFSLRNRLTEEERSSLFALKILFGSEILDYMIVVFTNEDALNDDGDTLEEFLKGSTDFSEILEACNDRKVLFDNRARAPENRKLKQVQELLNHVEEIAMKNGKPYMDVLSHEMRESETVFQEKYSGIFEKKGQSHEQHQFNQMMERMETKLREASQRLEEQLKGEQEARHELKKRANEDEKRSSDEIEKLRKDLELAKKMTKDFEEKYNNKCAIL